MATEDSQRNQADSMVYEQKIKLKDLIGVATGL